MKKIIIPAFILLSVNVFADNVNVRSFGAVPDDGKDDTKALRKAAEYCRVNPGTTLTFPPGTYNIKDKDAIKLEQRAYGGEFGINIEPKIFTPYHKYVKGLDFAGSTDVTVKASGATLLCDGWMEPISITGARNFTLEGLTIDYQRKPFSHGEVIAVTPEYFDVRFSNERIITEQLPLMRMTFWDNLNSRVDPELFYFPKHELMGDNVVRFPYELPDSLLGATANVNHCFHFRPAILIQDSENTTLLNVTIHSQPGMGIVGFDSKDIALYGLSVKPAPGYSQSTNTDATHFAACSGLIRFNGCYFQGQGDDATNVHGYYQSVNKADGCNAELQIKAPTYTHAQVIDAPRAGDTLELVEISTLRPVGTVTVIKSEHQSEATTCDVELSEPLPSDFQNYYLMNISKLPDLIFSNNVVNSHLARGVLVKTRNVSITGNLFRHCTGTAIHVGAEASWHEGSHAKNVVISDNTISGCGSGAGGQGGASGISVIIDAAQTDSTYLHENILIRNNIISGEGNQCGIYVGNASDVTLENNKVNNCKDAIHTRSTTSLTIR